MRRETLENRGDEGKRELKTGGGESADVIDISIGRWGEESAGETEVYHCSFVLAKKEENTFVLVGRQKESIS